MICAGVLWRRLLQPGKAKSQVSKVFFRELPSLVVHWRARPRHVIARGKRFGVGSLADAHILDCHTIKTLSQGSDAQKSYADLGLGLETTRGLAHVPKTA